MSHQQEIALSSTEPHIGSQQQSVLHIAPTHQPFQNLQLKSELGFMDVIGHMIVWVLLSIVTLGLALFVFPYYMQRFIISKTYAYDGEGKRVGRLVCTIDLASIIGKIILWAIISIVTLGIGYLVFMYKITAHCMTHTKIVGVNSL